MATPADDTNPLQAALGHWMRRAISAEAEVRRLQAERRMLMRRYGLLSDELPSGETMAVYGGDAEDDEGSRGDTVEIERSRE